LFHENVEFTRVVMLLISKKFKRRLPWG